MSAPAQVRLSEFRMAIRQTLDCEVEDVAEVVHVRLARADGKAWEGTVHIFEIRGHPKATRCYAWPDRIDGRTLLIRTILHSEKICSPEKAVASTMKRSRHA
jgi:hypothetical protein